MTAPEQTAIIRERIAALGIRCADNTAEQLLRYQQLVETWNQHMNLTGDAGFEAMLDRHLMDSLTPLTVQGLLEDGATLIDVGTGAGLPGIPLAIARPDLRVTLLDSMQKRIKFLSAVAEALELSNVTVLHARAEVAAHRADCREQFAIATARAVAALPVLQELLLPFVAVGGKCVCLKGPAAEDERMAGAAAAKLLGGGVPDMLTVNVPFAPERTHILVVTEKLKPTAKHYPRSEGTPSKHPLGCQ